MKITPAEIKKILDAFEERARGGWMSGKPLEEMLADFVNRWIGENLTNGDGKGAYP